jgi:hypothetical protein
MTMLEALQTTLRAEHAALYVYGTLGAQTSRSAQPALYDAVSSAYATHRARRDLLVRAIADLGATPDASAPSYVVPRQLGTPQEVRRAALELERGCAETYAWLVANTVGERRRWAAGALNDAAVRELAFRGTPEMLPGADEYTDR